MNNYLNLLGILSFLGAIISAFIYYKKNNTTTKPKKNETKIFVPLKFISIILSIVFIVCATITGFVDPIANTTTVDAQKNGVTALSPEEREKKEWDDFVSKNSKMLSAGEYTIGKNIDEGIYDIEFKNNGNLIIKNTNNDIVVNSTFDLENNNRKFRGKLSTGHKIIIEKSDASFIPVKSNDNTHNIELYSGQWRSGDDIPIGKYIVNAKGKRGNITILSADNKEKLNKGLGSEYITKDLKVKIDKGDSIYISSLESVTFEPSN